MKLMEVDLAKTLSVDGFDTEKVLDEYGSVPPEQMNNDLWGTAGISTSTGTSGGMMRRYFGY